MISFRSECIGAHLGATPDIKDDRGVPGASVSLRENGTHMVITTGFDGGMCYAAAEIILCALLYLSCRHGYSYLSSQAGY